METRRVRSRRDARFVVKTGLAFAGWIVAAGCGDSSSAQLERSVEFGVGDFDEFRADLADYFRTFASFHLQPNGR